jgi:hypothetical protein
MIEVFFKVLQSNFYILYQSYMVCFSPVSIYYFLEIMDTCSLGKKMFWGIIHNTMLLFASFILWREKNIFVLEIM